VNYRNRKLLDLMAGESKLAQRAGVLMPCQWCSRWLPTCGAHSNQMAHGKGRGIKAHDCFAAALCMGCHSMIDSGNLSREEGVRAWFLAHCSTFVCLVEERVVMVPRLKSGTWALPGTVDSATWLEFWTSGAARVKL
jgi:hypothetical protein